MIANRFCLSVLPLASCAAMHLSSPTWKPHQQPTLPANIAVLHSHRTDRSEASFIRTGSVKEATTSSSCIIMSAPMLCCIRIESSGLSMTVSPGMKGFSKLKARSAITYADCEDKEPLQYALLCHYGQLCPWTNHSASGPAAGDLHVQRDHLESSTIGQKVAMPILKLVRALSHNVSTACTG